MWLVTAIKDTCESNGVEVAGIFGTKEKAYEAKQKVEVWMEENGYEDYEVFATHMDVNRIKWYEVEEDI